jgi:hypothetical protein
LENIYNDYINLKSVFSVCIFVFSHTDWQDELNLCLVM